ncbi:MAG: sugar transferase [Planctomycetaceae bacterium]|nr:sugar transferase [Planctomycetaceae bacterium]
MSTFVPTMSSGAEPTRSPFDTSERFETPVIVTSARSVAPIAKPHTWNGVERRRFPRPVEVTKPALPLEPDGNLTWFYQATKRLLDVVGAAALLAILSPLLLAVYAALYITTRGRPLFVQDRVGYCGRTFRMFKFRTMHLDADRRQHEIRNEQTGPVFKNRRDPRVTPLGRWLRSTSIDEMPQLFNVLLGEMSLVGPRPPVMKEVVEYEAWHMQRLRVKPGLTCLWQVSGRCEIGFHDWVRMDIWYIEHQSLLVDLMLLLRTPWSVLSRRGAY